MLDFHIVSCSCHGQMILVRALDVVGDAGTQTVNRTFGNTEPTLGFEPTQVSVHTQSSLIGPTPTGGMAVATHRSLPPVIPPTVHCAVCGAIEVPQRLYRSAVLSSDPTYDNGEVIVFSQGGCGVPIVDASNGRLAELLGGDDLVFADTTVSTFSIRIEWPGYKMWNGQFRARSWGGTNDPVIRSRLAIQIARRVIEFLEAMEDVESTDLAWKVGRGHITARDLVLVSLAQVSKGSWQPLLRLLV